MRLAIRTVGNRCEIKMLVRPLVSRAKRSKTACSYAATPRVDWPRLLRRTFEVDVLQCSRCNGRLRILSVITDEPAVARILPALGLPTDAPIVARARDSTDLLDFDQSDAASLFE